MQQTKIVQLTPKINHQFCFIRVATVLWGLMTALRVYWCFQQNSTAKFSWLSHAVVKLGISVQQNSMPECQTQACSTFFFDRGSCLSCLNGSYAPVTPDVAFLTAAGVYMVLGNHFNNVWPMSVRIDRDTLIKQSPMLIEHSYGLSLSKTTTSCSILL